MFYYLDGTVAEILPYLAVIDCGGVGYACKTTNYTLSRLKKGQRGKLYTYLDVGENAFGLYGFATQNELNSFKLLIGVSGIGPKGALGILSSISPNAFQFAVMSGDSKAISKAPGIGPKTAQKLIIELKDKLKLEDMFEEESGSGAEASEADNTAGKEVIMALVSLGYSETEAFRAVKKVEASPETDSETLLKLALKQMLTF